MARLEEDATAFADRSARYMDADLAIWDDDSERDEHIAWSREFHEAMRPHCRGTSNPNFTGDDEPPDVVARAYGPAKHARLAAVKARHDPHNLFRLNQNIRPAGWLRAGRRRGGPRPRWCRRSPRRRR